MFVLKKTSTFFRAKCNLPTLPALSVLIIKGGEEMEKFEKLKDLIKDIHIAMLTTVETDGSLRSRPMATTGIKENNVLWFFTKIDSPKISEIEHDRHVNVNYMDRDKERYISVSGKAAIVKDQNKINELWTPVLKAWFDSKDDPQVALLRVEVEKAEYWDAPSGKLKQTFEMARTALTGHEYSQGEHEKLNFK